MSKEKPDHHDAEIVMKLYDLRREAVMRQSRDGIAKFMPKTYEDFIAATKGDHPLNVAYRMVSSYWEMAAGFVKHGALHLDLFAENCGEGLFIFAKAQPHLERLRKEVSPTSYVNMEWVVKRSKEAQRRLAVVQRRLAAMGK